jgi:hypothetical protein
MLVRHVPAESLLFVRSELGALDSFAPGESWRVQKSGVRKTTVNQILDYLEPRTPDQEPEYETLMDQEQYLLALEDPRGEGR